MYQESETVKKLRQQAQAADRTTPGSYVSANEAKLNQLYQALSDRKAFRYDPSADPLYQSYRQQYVTLGRRAMEDTLGQAAGLTGGYAGSYGQTAGQQAYDGYLQQLNGRLPELANLARQSYQDQEDRLRQQYDRLQQQEQTDYSRWRDTLSDAYQRQQQAQALYRDARDFDYQQQRDAVADAHWQADYNLSAAKAAASSSSGSGSSGKAEKTYDGMTDAQLTARLQALRSRLTLAQTVKVLQGSNSGLTKAQAARALQLLQN